MISVDIYHFGRL